MRALSALARHGSANGRLKGRLISPTASNPIFCINFAPSHETIKANKTDMKIENILTDAIVKCIHALYG